MIPKPTISVPVCLALVLALSTPAGAAASKCTALKLKATGKAASSTIKCYAKAVGKGAGVDSGCVTKASTGLASAFTKAESSADCLTAPGDEALVQGQLGQLVNQARGAVNGGAMGPSKCDSRKLAAMGKKASSKAGCHAKAVAKGVGVDSGCLGAAETKFSSAIGKDEGGADCTNTGQASTLEGIVDAFVTGLVCTLTNTGCTPGLRFTTTAGTTSCGAAGLTSPPLAPFSGEIDSDTAGTTKISDLGRGCLYLGGGNATLVPPPHVPDGATSFYGITGGSTLAGSNGTSNLDCTRGAGPGQHCVNGSPGTGGGACTADTDCGGAPTSCALDANCFFGPPLGIPVPVPFQAFSSCVLNAVATDASGTIDQTTGAIAITLPLSSRVYITGNNTSACPQCVAGTCNYGQNAGGSCATTASSGASQDCPPSLIAYQAALPLTLNPLTTGAASMTDAAGSFCPSQPDAGAFGQLGVRRIAETGTAAGDLTDAMAHPAVLSSVVCVPPTGSPGLDAVLDIPGPAALSLSGSARVQ